MMECANIKEVLSEYIDGILDSQTEARVEEHLSTCRACQEELSSLKAVVNGLSSLESVKAPEDFLEKLHERMESRFTVRKLMRILFVPAWTKIPLEVATVAAIMILIFVGLYTPQPEKQIAMAPESSTEIRAAKRTTADSAEPELKQDAYEAKPALKAETAEQPVGEREPIELVLSLETEPSGAADLRPTATRAAPAPAKEGRAVEEERTDVVAHPGTEFVGQSAPDAETKADETLSKVADLINRVEGSILSIEFDKQTHQPQIIRAEIPSRRYVSFREELERLALLQAPPPAIPEKGQETIQIRIRLISPD